MRLWPFSAHSLCFVRVVAATAIDRPVRPRLKRHIGFVAASRTDHTRPVSCLWLGRWLRISAAIPRCGTLLTLPPASFSADRRRVVVIAEIILVFGSERKDTSAVDANERGVGFHGCETIAKRRDRECQENKICTCPISPIHAVRANRAQKGIGLPRAARIISLVQPAQQWYLRGSVTEIARWVPRRSSPRWAHAGQRAM